MSIRLSGMISGLDTDAIVQGLSSAYQVKVDKVTKKKKKAEWQMEAWSTLNSKIYSLYTGTLSKIKTYGNYKTKKASVSGGNNSSVSVKASNTAVDGTYKVKVNSTASSAFITGASLSSQKYTASYSASNATTFNEMYETGAADKSNTVGNTLNGKTLTFSGMQYNQVKNADGEGLYTLTQNGVNTAIKLYDADGNETGETQEATMAQINEYLNQMAKASPDFDRSQYSANEVLDAGTAVQLQYTFTDSSSVTDINTELKNAGFTGLTVSMKDGALQFNNTAGYTMNADGSLKDSYGTYQVTGDDALQALGMKTDASGKVDVAVSATQNDSDGKYVYNTSVTAEKSFRYQVADTSLSGKSTISEFLADTFDNNAQVDSENGKRYLEYNLVMGTGSSAKTTTLKIYEDQTMDQFCSAIKDASGGAVNASFDATNQRFFLTSSKTGAENNFTLESAGSNGSLEALQKLGLTENSLYTGNAVMSRKTATDAEIELNGAVLTSSTNDVKVSSLGLTITTEAADPGEELTVTVANDTDAVYDMIKEFIKEYNNLVADMSEQYYADATTYEPLTDEEEAEMTDSQIDKWEKKAKSALLRRDSQLNNVMTNMRSELAKRVTITGADGKEKRYSLSSFGVCTGNWDEYGLLHINGDADDPEYAAKTNKLKEALGEDPDAVMNVFAQIGTNLYNRLGKMMGTSKLSSTQTIYNDKSMKSQISDYDDEISTLQEKLKTLQDKYYKQFSNMEVALSKLQSTASSLGFNSTTSGY